MRYAIELEAEQGSIAIMRVRNGWLVRTDALGAFGCGVETPLMVAETPGALAKIVGDWAASQCAKSPGMKGDAP